MPSRSRYQGVIQIVSFNRGFYRGTLAAMALASAAAIYLHGLLRIAILMPVLAALAWMGTSLVVSYYVYDRSPLYGLSWLKLRPGTWANVHAGLDETSETLRAFLPESQGFVWDIFDAEQMTEPSMARAREFSGSPPAERVLWRRLPVGAETLDAIFLMFVAHEFRDTDARHEFLREVARVLKPGGSIMMVEHLRDLPNFLAYGPGCLHFHSRRTWNEAFRAAELTLRSDRTLTPFVHAFELGKRREFSA